MSIEKMALVNIVGNMEDLDASLNQCCVSECFHIESAVHNTAGTGFVLLNETNPYSAPLKKLLDIAADISIKVQYADFSALNIPNDQLAAKVDELESIVHDLSEKKSALKKQISDYEQAIKQLEHLKGSPVDFDTLFACKEVQVRFGRLPVDSYKKLSYYDHKTFFFFDYDHNDDYYWGYYIAPTAKISVIDDIFASLFYERIWVPDYAHGTPDSAIEEILHTLEESEKQYRFYEERLKKISDEHMEEMNTLFSKLTSLNETFDMRKYVAVFNNHFYLNGFIPFSKKEEFQIAFKNIRSVSCIVKPQDADPSLTPPVKLKNGWFSKPFESFVTMYGLPSHTDIDPTPLVAITYTLLFGLMFGDVGQGLVISLIGYLMYKLKKMDMGKIFVRIGFSSAFFGVIYGSVFGFEDLLDPFYQKVFHLESKPIEVMVSTNNILIGAVILGALMIILTICINIILGIKHKNYERAFFGANGLAGLVLYGSILIGAGLMLLLDINIFNPIFIIICIVIPLLLMFLRDPLSKLCKKRKDIKPEGGIGGFITENFFELFEFLLSYVTNTMSFLRVGGFILSHAGMMAVVFTLAHSFNAVGSPIVIIFGNIRVMGMEGLIVGIQVLRLEFYEIFSRFFEGDGKPFIVSKINYLVEEEK